MPEDSQSIEDSSAHPTRGYIDANGICVLKISNKSQMLPLGAFHERNNRFLLSSPNYW